MRRWLDDEGRIGGRINVVDALCVVFLLGLIPVAYTSWLLFQPAQPQIHSVERSEVTWAEERIAAGLPIRMKVKIRGAHLTPMLRVTIGDVPAIGFTFEGPASGDVIIGENVPPGTHDIVLYDGTQEVARARNAVTVQAHPGVIVRAIGAFTMLDRETANRLQVGQQFAVNGRLDAEILALGDVAPDRRTVRQGSRAIEVDAPDGSRRNAIVRLRCDPAPDPEACHVDGHIIGGDSRTIIQIPGSPTPLRLLVDDIAPDRAPTKTYVRVSADAAFHDQIKIGDRDVRWPDIDDRAAVVTKVGRGAGGRTELTLLAGLDRFTKGWRYHGQPVTAGDPFTFVGDRYALSGEVLDMVIDEQ